MPKDSYASGPSSNPSSKSYSGGGGGGGVSSGKTTSQSGGIKTGNVIHGNTAYGPSGGMATGYATRQDSPSGIGPSVGTYSNFRNLDGSAAIPGAGNMPAMGRNAQQARSILERQFNPVGRPRVGGLLDGEQVAVGPIPQRRIVPMGYPIPTPRPLSALEQFSPWWNEPVSVGPVPMRPRPRPTVPNIFGGKINGPLGSAWDDRISADPGYHWTSF